MTMSPEESVHMAQDGFTDRGRNGIGCFTSCRSARPDSIRNMPPPYSWLGGSTVQILYVTCPGGWESIVPRPGPQRTRVLLSKGRSHSAIQGLTIHTLTSSVRPQPPLILISLACKLALTAHFYSRQRDRACYV